MQLTVVKWWSSPQLLLAWI